MPKKPGQYNNFWKKNRIKNRKWLSFLIYFKNVFENFHHQMKKKYEKYEEKAEKAKKNMEKIKNFENKIFDLSKKTWRGFAFYIEYY